MMFFIYSGFYSGPSAVEHLLRSRTSIPTQSIAESLSSSDDVRSDSSTLLAYGLSTRCCDDTDCSTIVPSPIPWATLPG